MNRKKLKIKNKPFKVVYEYADTPDAEARIFKALDILFNDRAFSLNTPSLVVSWHEIKYFK
ncbi:MAG: hypothetical protein V1688_00030 [bacterium]